jgi:hypothetical protein
MSIKSGLLNTLSGNVARNALATWCQLPVAICAAAILCGMLASTGNYTLIGAGLAAIIAPFLLAKPDMVVSTVIFSSLAAGAFVSLAGPSWTAVSWLISILSFSLLPLALARFVYGPKQPSFLWLTLGFFLYGLATSAIHWQSLEQLVAGTKRYFQGYGVLFALAVTSITARDINRWKRIIIAMACLQLPFAVYEFIVLVPQRGGLEAGGEATDVVAGTFGANLEGGSSNAEMSAFVMIVLVFFLAGWRAGTVGSKKLLWAGLICMAPLALGETKIVVILLPLMVLTLLRKDIMANPWRHSGGIAACALLTLLLGYVYIMIMDSSSVEEAFALLNEYNAGPVGYGGNLLNRMTVLTFWWDHHELSDPGAFLFGHGLGSSFWADNTPLPGHVAVLYPNYGIGLTSASTLLWDLGLFGFFFHLSLFVAAWIAANRVWKTAAEPSVRYEALAVQSAISCFVVYIFYRDSGVNLLAYEVVIACVLGYLAFLCRAAQKLGVASREPEPVLFGSEH